MFSAILFILSVILPGLGLGSLMYPRVITGPRLAALVFGAGSALITFELFLYFVIFRLSAGPGLGWFMVLQALVGALLFIRRFSWMQRLTIQLKPVGVLAWVIGIVVAACIGLGLLQALARPPVAYDSIAFWAMRGQILQVDGRVNFTAGSPTYLSALSHQNYPWHLSLMEYWVRFLGGQGGVVNLIAWLYFLSLAILVGDFCVRRLGLTRGLLLTFFLCTQPLIFYHASNNYADLIVAYYAAAGFAFFLEWLERQRPADLCFAAALVGWTFGVKNYGSFYIIALGAALGLAWLLKVWRPSVKAAALTLAALALPILPIALFKAFFRLDLHNSPAAWVWRPDALPPFLTALFLDNNWNIWWFIFVAVALLMIPAIRRQKELLLAWFFFTVPVAILLVIFTITENYQWSLDHTALPRSFIPLIPLSVLLTAFSFQRAKMFLCKQS